MANERLIDFPAKPTPVPADIVYVGDSADAYNEVQCTIEEIINAYPGLLSIGELTTVANQLIYTTGANAYSTSTLTPYARGLLADANAAAAQITLALQPGVNVQAYSASLASIAGLTTVANNLIYTTAADTYAVIAPVNDGVLVTSAVGVPSISSTLPTAVQANITQLGTQAQALDMGTQFINNVIDPVSAQDAATKAYVDAVATGLNIQPSVAAASIGNFSATYANGTAGVGATLTATANGAFTLDGVAGVLNARYLIKDQTSTLQNGIYTLTQVGTAGTPAILTRATDYDTITEITPGDLVVVNGGDTNAGTGWIQTQTVATIGTDPILFSLFSSTANADQANLIIGGNFDTNPWQRGTSFTSPASSAYTADRFRWGATGTGVVNILKTTDAPTVSQAGIFSVNCFHVDVTTADTSPLDPTDVYNITYSMEGYDWGQLAQRAFTLSFWVKSTITGIYSVAFFNGADRTYVAEYTVNASDTWEKKTITVSASPSSGTWNYTNGVGLRIYWTIASGTSNQTSSLNTWNSNALTVSSNQVNGMSSAANNFKLQLIKIEPGSAATAWQVRSEEEELKLCQRYFEKTFNAGVTPAVAAGSGGAIGYGRSSAGAVPSGIQWRFKVKKRAVPTITFYGLLSGSLWNNITTGVDSGASTAGQVGEDSIFAINAGAASDGVNCNYGIHATADAEF